MDDLSSFTLETEHRYCDKCCPIDNRYHKVISICAVCTAYDCGCLNCEQWLHDYAYSFTVLCICEPGALQRIDTQKAPMMEAIINRNP